MMPLEAFAWFMIGSGTVMLGRALYLIWGIWKRRRFIKLLKSLKKVSASSEGKLKELADKLITSKIGGQEISEMTFRDKDGHLNVIRIIIDHDLPDISLPDRDEFQSMVLKGEAGKINEVPEKAMDKVQEFIFSPQAVRDMRRAGMEPDEVVTKMLKASGRME